MLLMGFSNPPPFHQGAVMKLETLEDVFVDQLKDLYSAESQLIRSMPKMAKMCQAPELIQCLKEHLEVTERQRDRLDRISEIMDKKLSGKGCKAMKGLLEEGREAEEFGKGPVRDSLIVAAAQRIEHYEIAGYGTARAMAQALGRDELVKLLDQTLQEEGDADKLLTKVVYESVYPRVRAMEVLDDESARAAANGQKKGGKKKTAKAR
jgi:ferritin-like metal-binding protein YciE